jgi:hypothetical protein
VLVMTLYNIGKLSIAKLFANKNTAAAAAAAAAAAQPGICRFNLDRLAEALSSIPVPSAADNSSADAAAAATHQPPAGDPAAAAGGGGGEGAAHKSILPGAVSRKALAVYEDEFIRWVLTWGQSHCVV